jgi:hypothetical protein
MAEQDDLEAAITAAVAKIENDFSHIPHLRWSVVRGLIHRAVHLAQEGKGVEFCALATYLGEMVGHAHKIMHGDNPRAPTHKDFVH